LATLLLGGMDSPWRGRLMKRGCRVIFVHFHSVPYLPATSQAKRRALVERLTAWQYASRLHQVAFGEIQREVVLSVPPPLARGGLPPADDPDRRGAGAALGRARAGHGGELGQVASQTLENSRASTRRRRCPSCDR